MQIQSLHSSSPDTLLLHELSSGNVRAFDFIFNKYYDNLCRFACSFIHDADMSQSLVQNVFVKLWERRVLLGKIENLGGYLTRMVRNQVSDYLTELKKMELKHEHRGSMADDSTEHEILGRDFEERLIVALGQLPPRCRQAFELSRFENLSNKEIATEMNISVKGVEALIARSLKTLRVELREFLPSFKLKNSPSILFFMRMAKRGLTHLTLKCS
ncbi:RNA polymerase sigma-70 factor [Gaoshiqia sediminis]|uniref:RNA polymerase sigma-70 factor n=1 Tax=Gaoshiqia sediminis TaxID=2986998 RepID=A0AA41Y4X1_9BACT|nr:RNA polymerase sigma-70 factor [Gaoshiqia sediminis]MCW0481586.1 RNA polymerase sigma-70 factor [Gaoshiqia sediminis]